MIGEIGLKHVEFIPEIVPVLISFLKDDTPAVTRQAILSGTYLFRNMLERIAIQVGFFRLCLSGFGGFFPFLILFYAILLLMCNLHVSSVTIIFRKYIQTNAFCICA